MKKIKRFWKNLTIKNKIKSYTGSVFIAIIAALLLDVWIIRLFMVNFNYIMEDNANSGEIISALNRETDAFDRYIHGTDQMSTASWNEAALDTKKALDNVELDYKRLGDERYAHLFSLKTAYEQYCIRRDELIDEYQSGSADVSKLYEVYESQSFLTLYAQRFVDITMTEGNAKYQEMVPVIMLVPFLVAALGAIIFITIINISRMLNASITVPVLKLASASRKIAANNFFIDDVQVDNNDEIGELVTAFNKMKYATGEYIRALEDKREALDKLHVKELETLEIEKQLETMNLEVLKNQINPHFLFNTLNVIAGTANLEEAPTTEQMIEALSSLFRYNLKTQAKETLLSQELKISRDYMYLQQKRFGERVGFEIDCDVDEEAVLVPTFTLQPLLENAVIHGISQKVEGGKVYIKIRHTGDRLLITVGDTGAGIDERKLELIKRQLNDKDDGKDKERSVGIGIGNIYRRIKAMYDTGTMDIVSPGGEGCIITIDIPYHGREL